MRPKYCKHAVYGLDMNEISTRAGMQQNELIQRLLSAEDESYFTADAFIIGRETLKISQKTRLINEKLVFNDNLMHVIEQFLSQLVRLPVNRLFLCLPDTEVGRDSVRIVNDSFFLKEHCHFQTIHCHLMKPNLDAMAITNAKTFFNIVDHIENASLIWFIKADEMLSVGTLERMRVMQQDRSRTVFSSDTIQHATDHIYLASLSRLFSILDAFIKKGVQHIEMPTSKDSLHEYLRKIEMQQNIFPSFDSIFDEMLVDRAERYRAFQVDCVDQATKCDLLSDPIGPECMNEGATNQLLSHQSSVFMNMLEDEPIEVTSISESDLDHWIEATELPLSHVQRQAFLVAMDKNDTFRPSDHTKELVIVLPEQVAQCSTSKNVRETSWTSSRRSILPSDVTDIAFEAEIGPSVSSQPSQARVESVKSVQLVVKKQVPMTGYIILSTALIVMSSQGAVIQMLNDVPPLLRLFWRMFGASVAFLPIAYFSNQSHDGLRNCWTLKQWNLFFTCVIAFLIQNLAFLTALTMTSLAHVYIFGSCHSLLIVIGKIIFYHEIPQVLELFGTIIGTIGLMITTIDHPSAAQKNITPPSLTGDMVACVSACAAVVYLLSASKIRQNIPVGTFLFLLFTTTWIMIVPILFLLQRSSESYRFLSLMDTNYGLFGWTHHIAIELYIVLAGCFLGSMGIIVSMKYFQPLMISITMLLEPIFATSIAVLLGMSAFPGTFTILGNFTVMIGCFLVIYASHRSIVKVNISDAVHDATHIPSCVKNSIAHVADTVAQQSAGIITSRRRSSDSNAIDKRPKGLELPRKHTSISPLSSHTSSRYGSIA